MRTSLLPSKMSLKYLILLFILIKSHPFSYGQDTIRILAIGNSFSLDAVTVHLSALSRAQNTPLILGHLHIASGTLETHWENAYKDRPDYEYIKTNKVGIFSLPEKATISHALADDKWDYITFQQYSGFSGMVNTFFPYLNNLIAYVRERSVKPNPKLAFHQTWAYDQSSTHPGFVYYDNNQKQMYKAIVEASAQGAEMADIPTVIPAGTAIQYARSILGDAFCKDGYHLNSLGQYIAACTWLEIITGKSPIGNQYTSNFAQEQVDLAQSAAHYAATTHNDQALRDLINPVNKPEELSNISYMQLGEGYFYLEWEAREQAHVQVNLYSVEGRAEIIFDQTVEAGKTGINFQIKNKGISCIQIKIGAAPEEIIKLASY